MESVFGLAGILRLAWAAAILPIVVASLPLPFMGFVYRRVMGFAARGKTLKGSSKFTVPQRFFLHFYIVGSILTTVLLLSIWLYAYTKFAHLSSDSLNFSTIVSQLTGGSNNFFQNTPSINLKEKNLAWQTVFLLLLMEIQVLRRLHETLNVFHYSPSARLHILGYLTGLFFYIMVPLSIASPCINEAMFFMKGQIEEFIVKGRARMPDLNVDFFGLVKPLLGLSWRHLIGALIFFWGSIHQFRCHAILGSLRENKGADEYVIPYGDWFKYVSCPHYFAEIVIYAGILVASGGSDITIWLLFIFVVVNLGFAAAETHRWYKQKFEDYPKSRRAIIPFIY
ncbi:hypothetical protein LUZ60_016355 [Juncus effusus]|nr:hypothetical protein LUZ60_016355 [Juncus effusus]